MSILGKSIYKSFGDPPTMVIKNVDIEIKEGEFVSITGKSGSGKSTLLYMLSTLDPVTSGEIFIDDKNITQLSDQEIHNFRNTKMGFVFQFHYLLPELTALENVLMPARKKNLHHQKASYAMDLLKEFDLKGKEHRLSTELSGGEQQRVAVARALIMHPKYLFADEPTGNLDTVNAKSVMNHFRKLNQDLKMTVIYVTHDADFANLADRKIKLVDGKII